MITPKTLPGFRDFLPDEKRKRDWLTGKIVEVFEQFGFEPLETPTLEYASLLLGKYGAEADKLVYTFTDRGEREIGLRYDQTVPTARVLAQYQQLLPKYFRRYQLQNVFRAEKPQKGRYREFTQCDIDIFGSTDPIADAEIISCTYFAYKNVGYPRVTIKINDRQTLMTNLSPFATDTVSVFSIIQSIDKLDKINREGVALELTKKGLPQSKAIGVLESIQSAVESDNLKKIIQATQSLGTPGTALVFTPTLARGLDYYTGMIFEVSVPEYGTDSLGGGGRYDELIEELGGVSIPAVGIAFGFDRMLEAASQLGLIPTENTGAQVLVTIFNSELSEKSLELTRALRRAGVRTEVYVSPTDKLDKQLKYADKKAIPYVVILGPDEIKRQVVKLKHMKTKEQEELPVESLINRLKEINTK